MSNNHTIQRAPRSKQSPYFSLSRSAAQDKDMSYEARGLLAYLLSKPDDWKAQLSDIQNEHCGRDKARRMLNELVAHGYAIAPKRYRDKMGQWTWTSYLFYEEPQLKPFTENPSTDNPLTENTSIYIVETHKEEKKEKEIPDTQATQDTPPKKPRSTKQLANDALVDALGKALGVLAVGKDYSNYLKVAQALIEAGIPADEFAAFVSAVKAESGGKWKVTPNALTGNGRMSEYVGKQRKPKTSTPDTETDVVSLSYEEQVKQNLLYGAMAQGDNNGDAG